MRPIIGGTAINDILFEQRCTLGYVWIHGGVRHVLTNAHCTGGSSSVGSVSGIMLYQPRYSASVDNAIGEEVIDPPFFDNTADSKCPAGLARGCRYSDAAAFRIYDHVSTDRNGHPTWIADSGGGTDSLATIVGYHKISGYTSAIAGDYLRKIGSRTG